MYPHARKNYYKNKISPNYKQLIKSYIVSIIIKIQVLWKYGRKECGSGAHCNLYEIVNVYCVCGTCINSDFILENGWRWDREKKRCLYSYM